MSRKSSSGVGEFGTIYVVCTYFLIFLIKNFFIPSSSSALPSKAAQEGIFLGCLFLSTNKPEKEKKFRETKLQLLTFFIKCKQTADDDSFLPLNPANALASGSVSLRIPEKEKGEKIT